MLIKGLIILFIIIIFYEIFNDAFTCPLYNTPYNTYLYENFETLDPVVSSQKNAGDILLLKDQITSHDTMLKDLQTKVTNIDENVKILNDQVRATSVNNGKKIQEITGDKPLDISKQNV